MTVLDELRQTYELAKGARHPELQAHLMQARRLLLDSLRQNVDLHSEMLELQARVAELEAENERLRVRGDSDAARAAPIRVPRLS